MSEKISGETRSEFDPKNRPAMSRERMVALRAMKDEEIDLRDIPEQLGPPTRRVYGPRFGVGQETVSIDAKLLEFFKKDGGSPAAGVDAVLRAYVEAQRKTA